MCSLKIVFFTGFCLLLPRISYSQSSGYVNSINANYEHVFVENQSNWNLGQLWYKRNFTDLTSVFKIKYADRFDWQAYFTEVDLYPRLSKRSYAHFNVGAGLNRMRLFPHFQIEGKLFYNFTPAFVGGVGLEYKSFEDDDVLLYDSHLRLYAGDYLIMAQGLLQVRDNTPLGTGLLTIRKYFDSSSYIYVKGAYGQAPQNLRFENDALNSYASYFIAAGVDIDITKHFILRSAINYRESIFSDVSQRKRFGVSLGIGYQF